jgi:hypothetical protein
VVLFVNTYCDTIFTYICQIESNHCIIAIMENTINELLEAGFKRLCLDERYLVNEEGIIYDAFTDDIIYLGNTKRSKNPSITLRIGGRDALRRVANIVATVFCNNNEPLTRKQKIIFLDGDRSNIKASNMEVGLHKSKSKKKKDESVEHGDFEWLNGTSGLYC